MTIMSKSLLVFGVAFGLHQRVEPVGALKLSLTKSASLVESPMAPNAPKTPEPVTFEIESDNITLIYQMIEETKGLRDESTQKSKPAWDTMNWSKGNIRFAKLKASPGREAVKVTRQGSVKTPLTLSWAAYETMKDRLIGEPGDPEIDRILVDLDSSYYENHEEELFNQRSLYTFNIDGKVGTFKYYGIYNFNNPRIFKNILKDEGGPMMHVFTRVKTYVIKTKPERYTNALLGHHSTYGLSQGAAWSGCSKERWQPGPDGTRIKEYLTYTSARGQNTMLYVDTVRAYDRNKIIKWRGDNRDEKLLEEFKKQNPEGTEVWKLRLFDISGNELEHVSI